MIHIQKNRMSAIWITLCSYGPLVGAVVAGAALFFTAANVMGVV